MTVEATNLASAVNLPSLTGAVRRDDNPALAREQATPRTDAVAANADVQVAAFAPQQGERQQLLDRVAATQIAREALNQVESSLVEQRDLARIDRETGSDTTAVQRDLQEERAQLSQREGTIFSAPERDLLVDQSLRSEFVSTLERTTDQANLATEEDLDAGLAAIGSVQDDLATQEERLEAAFNAQQDARLSPNSEPLRTPDQAEALVARIVEAETEPLVRSSNAVDDQQRQQVLNLLTV